jgi:GTPase SAR1 family protein
MTEMTEIQKCRVALLGDCGVGKTSLTSSKYPRTWIPTQGKRIEGDIIEFGGQDKYKWKKSDFQDFDLFIIMYDRGNRLTFDSIPFWHALVESYGKPIYLIGNKSDIKNLRVYQEDVLDLNLRHSLSIDISIKQRGNLKIKI